LLFSGALSGTVTAVGSAITNAFHPGHAAYDFILGGNHYLVKMAYLPDGAGSHVGSLNASIMAEAPGEPATGSAPPPPAVSTPEPSTMVLAMVGLTCGAWSAWRSRRKA